MELDPTTLGTNLSVAGVLLVWLWKGLLPELRRLTAEMRGARAELTAIEKHLASAGQARVHLEGAVKEIREGVDFVVGHVQRANGRSTAPGEPDVEPDVA